MRGSRGLWLVALVSMLTCGFLLHPSAGGAAEKASLSPEDCIKCHETPPADIGVDQVRGLIAV